MNECDICGREKGLVPPLCGRDRPGATFPDMADCYSTGFYRLKREKTLAGQQIAALVADARAAYPVCSRCGEDLIPHDGELCGACAKSELAADEERGRRAGIEEAAKIAPRVVPSPEYVGRPQPIDTLLRDAASALRILGDSPLVRDIEATREALAPRDSVADATADAMDAAVEQAPRDSGKEG